jgi:chemosensory pili system protein ChpA (sensor histidine kinase/response regulator)
VPLALQAQSTGIEGGPEAPRGPDGLSPEISALLPVAPTVMVVDDSLTVRKITSRLLARENYQVLTARDGVDALEQLQTARPDILLVDIEMPRMDGFDLTRNVRADAALKNLPIIMITSRAAEKHRKYAFEVGVDMFLGKPYQEEELLKNIAILVKRATAPA